jgi:hypothetical protein
VHQHRGVRVQPAHPVQREALELLVHDAGAVPEQHVGAGHALHIAAQMLVRRPEDLLALCVQVLDDGQRDAGGDDPVERALTSARGVGVDDDGAVRVRVAEGAEGVRRAALVQRAGGAQVRHQHALFGVEDLCRLAHEAHAADHQGGGIARCRSGPSPGVGDVAAGLLGQGLEVAVDIVVGHQHGVLLDQQRLDALFQRGLGGVASAGHCGCFGTWIGRGPACRLLRCSWSSPTPMRRNAGWPFRPAGHFRVTSGRSRGRARSGGRRGRAMVAASAQLAGLLDLL